MAAALVGSLLTVAPAEAHTGDPGSHVYGHRCQAGDNENTVAALQYAGGLAGVMCEIDATTIADGTVIAWHDATWRRVADPASLQRAGLAPGDRVRNATWSQVSQVRTKGGQPVARLIDMIDASGRFDVPLRVDMRNALTSPRDLVARATQAGADVAYYQLVQSSCRTNLTDRMRNAGAVIGIKLLPGGCQMTAATMQARGASFTQQLSFNMTQTFIDDANRLGITVGILDRGMTEDNAEALHARGITRFLLDDPLVARTWFDGPN
jgi:glycerophosphoryl diester phosphodiesterase